MRRLLSLPPNAVSDYHRLHERNREDLFCTSDPREKRLGSGSGTTWLLEECYREEHTGVDFMDWLSAEKGILIHAGGQSRRLPAYAVTGKISLPLPVFRWARGQRLSQDLLSLQLPLYEKIMQQSPASLRTLVVSGDVYIMHRKIKPNPAIFTQNAVVDVPFTEEHRNIWIENAHIGKGWRLSADNVVTGVPENDWQIDLPEGICIDLVPADEKGYVVRPYGIDDLFKGEIDAPKTLWMGRPVRQWLEERGLDFTELGGEAIDLQQAPLFPCPESKDDLETVLLWMIGRESLSAEGKKIWLRSKRFSADELMDRASLSRLYAQRTEFRQKDYPMLEQNYGKSVFYQLDLSDVAADYFRLQLPVPLALSEEADRMQRIHNRMLRSRIFSLQGDKVKSETEEVEAFSMLRNGLIEAVADRKRTPGLAALPDQIVWGRSPIRIDLAGGWTDTPPFSLYAGGNVVNMAIELNGQPPLQVYVKPCNEFRFVLRSIDMGATEVVETYDELRDYRKLGSPFSIPRAALTLCGFLPEFAGEQFDTLGEQLKAFGAGIEITLLAAIPAGSGLGTSSILAATVLGALNDFCGLQWNKQEIGTHTLVLEQLLTSGGGWQDQYGGFLHGVKLLESESGFVQKPQVSWLPESLFTDPAYATCHLLYYTGITRVAKNILGEIVRSMFLNSGQHLSILHEMKAHAVDMAECIQRGDFDRYGKLILKTWQQNKMIDSGTNPPEVERIIDLIKDYTLGYKLPGAGGGGYLYMVAKDPDAAVRIRKILNENRPNNKARFVEMQLSHKGFQVSRS